jgi:hypothetical protein
MTRGLFLAVSIPLLIIVPVIAAIAYHRAASKKVREGYKAPSYYLFLARDIGVFAFVILLAVVLFVQSKLS